VWTLPASASPVEPTVKVESVPEPVIPEPPKGFVPVEPKAKEPWEMGKDEYLKEQITGHIESDAYKQYETIEGLAWLKKTEHPVSHKKIEINMIFFIIRIVKVVYIINQIRKFFI
jgi:hypothetical protein